MNTSSLPGLDILIYAHDGRGLGHVSRSVAIGMAARRLFPDLKVLLVTGARITGELIGSAPLDWLKLPAYATRVVDGKSGGCDGPANFTDTELGTLRTLTLKSLITLYRPRCVLVDHMPRGKHKELQAAIEATRDSGTAWVLGLRGIVGKVPKLASTSAISFFNNHYRHILWYGDAAVLGKDQPETISRTFGVMPVETGYVSRFAEWRHWTETTRGDTGVATVISIPWWGEHTPAAMRPLIDVLEKIGDRFGRFDIFVGRNEKHDRHPAVTRKMASLPFCRLAPVGMGYFDSLNAARSALIYGGYNSLTDILFAGLPAIVLLRGMQDGEQEKHIELLNKNKQFHLTPMSEKNLDADRLHKTLLRQLTGGGRRNTNVMLNGAENAARILAKIINRH